MVVTEAEAAAEVVTAEVMTVVVTAADPAAVEVATKEVSIFDQFLSKRGTDKPILSFLQFNKDRAGLSSPFFYFNLHAAGNLDKFTFQFHYGSSWSKMTRYL